MTSEVKTFSNVRLLVGFEGYNLKSNASHFIPREIGVACDFFSLSVPVSFYVDARYDTIENQRHFKWFVNQHHGISETVKFPEEVDHYSIDTYLMAQYHSVGAMLGEKAKDRELIAVNNDIHAYQLVKKCMPPDLRDYVVRLDELFKVSKPPAVKKLRVMRFYQPCGLHKKAGTAHFQCAREKVKHLWQWAKGFGAWETGVMFEIAKICGVKKFLDACLEVASIFPIENQDDPLFEIYASIQNVSNLCHEFTCEEHTIQFTDFEIKVKPLSVNAHKPIIGEDDCIYLYSAHHAFLPKKDKLTIFTDLAFEVPKNVRGVFVPICHPTLKNIQLAGSVIDSNYHANIGITIYNFDDRNFTVPKGARIAKIMFERIDSDVAD